MPRDSQYAQVSVDETGDASTPEPAQKKVCGIERRHRKGATVFVCLFTAFVFAVNGGVLLVVIPTIARDFSTTNEVAAWANIAPGFISAMIGTQMGWVADKYGRASTWHAGMTFEVISHAVCGWAQTIPQLLFGRAIGGLGMGIGAGSAFGLMAAGMPPKQRGVAAAWMMLMGTLGRSFGTSIGGVIMDAVGWRWLFIGPVPVLVVMWVVAYFVLPFDAVKSGGSGAKGKASGPQKDAQQLDWAGSVLLALLMAFLLLGVNRGNEWGWGSPGIVGSLVVCAVLTPALIYVEMRAVSPVIPFVIFTDHISAACITMSILNGFNIGGFQTLSIFLQMTRGMSAGEVGALIMFRVRLCTSGMSPGCCFWLHSSVGHTLQLPNDCRLTCLMCLHLCVCILPVARNGRGSVVYSLADHHEAAKPAVQISHPRRGVHKHSISNCPAMGGQVTAGGSAAAAGGAAVGLGVRTVRLKSSGERYCERTPKSSLSTPFQCVCLEFVITQNCSSVAGDGADLWTEP